MKRPNWSTCPHCGEQWDSSGRYTSPANAALDRRWWHEEHLSGACATGPESAVTESGRIEP